MNIDFANHPGFSAYVLLLMFSGLLMVFLASPAVRQSKLWLRILNVVVGLGFFCYGFYLAFLFQGGSYLIFFKAFFVPVVLIVRTVQASRAARAALAQTMPAPAMPPAPPQDPWNRPEPQWAPQQQEWAPPPSEPWRNPQG